MFVKKMRVIGQTLLRRSHFDNKGCTCNLRILGTEKALAF